MFDLQQITTQDGQTVLKGVIAVPENSGSHPAILIAPSAHGLGDHARHVAMRLAGEGYVALACDIYGDGIYTEDRETVAELVEPLWGNADRLRRRMNIWHAALAGRCEVDSTRIGAIGYCFGGQCVLEHVRGGADIRAVVSFHGILATAKPAERDAVKGHVSVHTGRRDPYVPRQDVESFRAEMIAADADWSIAEYGNALHAFTDGRAASPEAGSAYNPLADQTSWAAALTVLQYYLKADYTKLL